jgi:acyl-CoA thioesterase-1
MRTITKAIVQLFIVVQIFISAGVANAETKVACIGDSITALGWPTILGQKLGAGYTVGNFGVSGTNMCKGGLQSYWDSAQYTPSHDFAPNIVVIMHGTNDSTTITWPNCASHFAADYEAFIDTYTSLPSHPKVYLNTPPPVGAAVFGQQEPVIEDEIIPAIKEVAKK